MSENNPEYKTDIKKLLKSSDQVGAVAKLSFEEGMGVLEQLVALVESGKLPLDETLSCYELSARLVTHLKGLLNGVEQKLKILKRDESGTIQESA